MNFLLLSKQSFEHYSIWYTQIMKSYKNIDEYLDNFPEEVQGRLEKIRKMIKDAVPEAGEKISYGIPAMTLSDKYFFYFAGYKNHISIYPITQAIEENVREALEFRTGKGTLQFPLNKPLPEALIKKIVKARLAELLKK